MSVIRKKPEINKIIEELNDTQKLKLATEVNNEAPLYTKSLINKNYYFSKLNNNAYEIAGILLQLTPTNTLPGIVVRTNNSNNLREYFIQFSHKQRLIMWKLDTINRTAQVIEEELDINELRRLLEEVHDHIEPGEIDSGEAAANALLVADGEGGADFVSPAEGSAQYLLGLDSEGNIVKDELPEGIVVDQTIVEDSENAVAGGAVYNALAEKADASDVYDKDAVDALLETKANVDGNYPTMTVGAADNLTPYDEDSGVDQEQPFLLQGTGCGNGEQQVDTGALALLKEKQGHSVVVNQQVVNGTFANTDDWNAGGAASMSVSDNIATVTASASGDNYMQTNVNMVIGHKYLLSAEIKTDSQDDASNNPTLVRIFYGGSSDNQTLKCNVYNQFIFATKIITCVSNQFNFIRLENARNDVSHLYKNVFLIDLTQWFGSNDNIPAHLLSHPEDFFRYYQGSLAYNEGTLVNSNGRYLKTIGRNQWDEEWELGNISSVDGQNFSYDSSIRSKNYIPVIPGETYHCKAPQTIYIRGYDKDKNYTGFNGGLGNGYSTTLPSNVCFLRFVIDLTTYNHDITISIYYDGESGYDQYYPYEELANIDTGTETLRSAGSVKDSKAPDGTIHRLVGYVDLGSLNWISEGGGRYHTTDLNDLIKKPGTDASGAMLANIITPNFVTIRWNDSFATIKGITVRDTDGRVAINGVSGTSDITGILFYELATETTEQGTTFSENVAIDDFGSMDFAGTNGIPQGASIFYPVDYKAFVDSLYNTLDGDATDIVKESELDSKLATLGYVKLTSVSGYDATKTQVLKNVEGTLTWVTEE